MIHKTAFFREAGSGPTVLCIHSSASSSGQWRALMAHLSDRFRVVAPDLYGYGKSPAWPHEFPLRLEDELDLMAPILADTDQVHLVGHSYGGLIALKMALSYPTKVASLTLYEPTCFFLLPTYEPAYKEIKAIRDQTYWLIDEGEPEAAAQTFVSYWAGSAAWDHTPEARRQKFAQGMQKVRLEWTNGFDVPLSMSGILALTIPILLMSGAQTTLAEKGVMQRLQILLSQAEINEFAEMGHMGPITHADEVNQTIATFLERVEEYMIAHV